MSLFTVIRVLFFLVSVSNTFETESQYVDEGVVKIPTEQQIGEHLKSNCTSCLQLDEAKLARMTQIKEDILKRLGFDQQMPKVKIAVDFPFLQQTPIKEIVKQYEYQSDSSSASFFKEQEYEDEEDINKIERIFGFAKPPPETFNFPSHLKTAYFYFSPDTKMMTVKEAILHIFIKPSTKVQQETYASLKIEIYRRTKKGKISTKALETLEIKHSLRQGIWIAVPLKSEVAHWLRKPVYNKGIFVKCLYKNENLAVHPQDQSDDHNMYIEMETKQAPKPSRRRRELSVDCVESQKITRCCRYPLLIDFEDFDWNWMIAPKRYNAYYCNGQCTFKHLQAYPHTHVLQQAQEKGILPAGMTGPCCHSTKTAPLKVIYATEGGNVHISNLNGLVTMRCGCA